MLPVTNPAFTTLKLFTPLDVLHYYPKGHTVYRRAAIAEVKAGDTVTVIGQVLRHQIQLSKAGTLILQRWLIANKSGRHRLSCIHFHPVERPYTSPQWRRQQEQYYAQGALVKLSGTIKPDDYTGGITISAPEVIPISLGQSIPRQTIQPHYRLTKGLDTETLQAHIRHALHTTTIRDPLPSQLQARYGLIPLPQALEHIHFPTDTATLEAARHRLAFDEFFYLQLALLYRRAQYQQEAGIVIAQPGNLLQRFYQGLPFTLTGAQQRVIQEIQADLAQTSPMNRLVQGDVGAGKTVVAVAACLLVIAAGYQAALMAPTEVLATQHVIKIQQWCAPLGYRCSLLTGSTPTKERKRILEQLANGQIHLLVGTHALLTKTVTFHQLGLAVIDEQHRFGVNQRVALQQKGNHPHMLSMTATPIPRTLALTCYGDLDMSLLDELPPGRKPIKTQVIEESRRSFIGQLITMQLTLGHQVYVILPLVERSEAMELNSATEAYHTYQQRFEHYTVGLLHGRMSTEEKMTALEAFRTNQSQILVSTTVIEVGVDVPNATMIVIEHAERFGLAQLHQLRGRVGRGNHQSYCLLVDTSGSSETRHRLEVLAQTNDGVVIAEADLQHRGAGDVLGSKQAGTPHFALADVVKDAELLEQARQAAQQVMRRGSQLRSWAALLEESRRRGHLAQALQQSHLN